MKKSHEFHRGILCQHCDSTDRSNRFRGERSFGEIDAYVSKHRSHFHTFAFENNQTIEERFRKHTDDPIRK